MKCYEDICLKYHQVCRKRICPKSKLSFAIVKMTKRGQTVLALPSKSWKIDLTIYMDVSSNPGPDCVHNTRRFSAPKVNSIQQGQGQRHLQIARLNVTSIKNRQHYILLKELVLKNGYDVFTVSESWLDNGVQDIEVETPGYNIYRLDLHQLWVKIQVRSCKSFIICIVYRPPNMTTNCFDEDLGNALTSALTFSKDVYILGDMNCNMLNPDDTGCQALLEFCATFNLEQLVK